MENKNNTDINIFIHSLSGSIEGYLFEKDTKTAEPFSIPPKSGIVDILSQFPQIQHIGQIFVVCGPASFTSLRNISVFVNTLLSFSEKKIQLYSIPTSDIFSIFFSTEQFHILSVGKRESFFFANNTYKKYKNPILAEKIVNEGVLLKSAGFFSDELLGLLPKDFLAPRIKTSEMFLSHLLQTKNKEKWEKKFLEIEYGAQPNIG